MIRKLMTSFISFAAGMLSAINLNFLLTPINDDYNAQWWKVCAAISVAVIIPILDNYSERK